MRRLLGVVLLLAGALVGSVAFGATPAFACRCVAAQTDEHAQRAAIVFTGTITSVREDSGPLRGDQPVTYDVAVDRVFKGDLATAAVSVATPSHGASCGLPGLPPGEPVAFFVSAGPDALAPEDPLSISSCGGTAVLTPELESAIVAALGEGESAGAPEASTASPTASATAGPDDPADQTDDSADQADDGSPYGVVVLALRVMAVGLIGLVLVGAAGAVAFAVVRLVLRRRRNQ